MTSVRTADYSDEWKQEQEQQRQDYLNKPKQASGRLPQDWFAVILLVDIHNLADSGDGYWNAGPHSSSGATGRRWKSSTGNWMQITPCAATSITVIFVEFQGKHRRRPFGSCEPMSRIWAAARAIALKLSVGIKLPLLGERAGVRALCCVEDTLLPHLNPLPRERKQAVQHRQSLYWLLCITLLLCMRRPWGGSLRLTHVNGRVWLDIGSSGFFIPAQGHRTSEVTVPASILLDLNLDDIEKHDMPAEIWVSRGVLRIEYT